MATDFLLRLKQTRVDNTELKIFETFFVDINKRLVQVTAHLCHSFHRGDLLACAIKLIAISLRSSSKPRHSNSRAAMEARRVWLGVVCLHSLGIGFMRVH